ncbi:MAG: hypothetical protein ACJAS4_003927 [Bacteriovoracaceae bacterium]|jgi:hypothetical protein
MKHLIISSVLLFSTNIFANGETDFVTTESWYSTHPHVTLRAFEKSCDLNVGLIDQKMAELETKYDDIQEGDLSVTTNLQIFWFHQNHHSYNGYHCNAEVSNLNNSYIVYKENSKMLKHLKKNEVKTACNKIVKENEENKEIIYQRIISGRTLLQGRYCYVYAIDLRRN